MIMLFLFLWRTPYYGRYLFHSLDGLLHITCIHNGNHGIVHGDWSKNVACRKHGYKGKKKCYACARDSNNIWGWLIVNPFSYLNAILCATGTGIFFDIINSGVESIKKKQIIGQVNIKEDLLTALGIFIFLLFIFFSFSNILCYLLKLKYNNFLKNT